MSWRGSRRISAWWQGVPGWVRTAAGYLPAALILPYLAGTVLGDLSRITLPAQAFRPGLAAGSLVLLMIHFFGTGWGSWALFRAFGVRLPVWEAVRITVLSLAGKYVPGKVWVVVGKVVLAGRLGAPGRVALAVSVYEVFLVTLTGVAVFLTTGRPGAFPGREGVLVAFWAAVGIALLVPGAIPGGLNLLLKLAKRTPLDRSLGRGPFLAAFCYYAAGWLWAAYSFRLMLAALSLEIPYPLVLNALAASYVAGFLVLFAPAGLGVREGVMAFLLAGAGVPAQEAAAAALVCRLWSTAGELLCMVPAFFWRNGAAGGHVGAWRGDD